MYPSLDPTRDPGAVLLYPDDDPSMRYDAASDIVTDLATGDRFSRRVVDPRDGVYEFFISSHDGTVLNLFKARDFTMGPSDAVQTVAHEVTTAFRGSVRDRSALIYREELGLDRLASFVNAFENGRSHVERGKTVLLVDNRERLRARLEPKI